MKTKALYLALGTALISSVSIFINKFAVTAIGNPYVLTTSKNIIVALLLTLLVLTPLVWKKLKTLPKNDWLKLVVVGLIGGSIPFLLFFKGLSLSTSVNAGFIHKTLFIWVTLLAIPFLKEKLSKIQWLALGVLLVGNYFLIGIKWSFAQADILIFAATLFWAVEFVIAKHFLKTIDPKIIAWGRMFFGAIFLLGYMLYTGQAATLLTLGASQWGFISLVAIFLLGYVLTWYHALAKLPVTVVASVLVIASPITTGLNSIFITHKYSLNQLIGSLIILASIVMISYAYNNLRQSEKTSETV
ncbi:DMT family transporter [Candidatus Woesearchaeota archaeon]|jgi:drug/metabolite transporter (DMT)-like permease|nr:DMT family transporter [Candidatus Woesearchaeota archaeon]